MDKAGGWSFRRADSTATFEENWEKLLHVERLSWKHGTGTSIANEHGANDFYRGVSAANANVGAFRLHLLEYHGVPVAHTLGVVHGSTYYLLKHSYDETHRQVSPGFQLMWHVMQESVAEGCTRIDLLGDVMSWKAAVATSQPRYSSHMLFPAFNLRCQRCHLTNTVLKPVARKIGVKRLIERIRRGHS
jgi:CelD/BcsL family acetyltransferase involved in cellulose biosynthesis